MALVVPLSRFTTRVGGGSGFYVKHRASDRVRYYIKKVGDEKIDGPYTVEQLNRSIHQGEIGSEWLATSDIGETRHMISRSSNSDWLWVSDVPGVVGVAVPRISRPTHAKWIHYLLVVAFILLVCIFLFIALVSVFNDAFKNLN